MMILISLSIMGGLGLVLAGVLAFAGEKLKVEEDPKVEKILAALPGLNCGACGSASCHDFAEKVAAQGTLDNLRCPPGGSEVEEELGEILGVTVEVGVKARAVIKCGGGKGLAVERAEYRGIKNCTAAELVAGGSKACTYGCLGFADCVRACPFNAMYMGEDNLPKVIEENCTACGLCVMVCPRKIIELVPSRNRVIVNCISHDRGAVVRKVCKVGCIGCTICVKEVPEAYRMDDNLAVINWEKSDGNAEAAMPKCPTKCIVKL